MKKQLRHVVIFHTENTSNFKTQTAKNGGFCEKLLSENDFEAVFVNFCCYEYCSKASETVQKISTRMLLRVSHNELGGAPSYDFFETTLTKTHATPWGAPHLKNNPPPHPTIGTWNILP